MNVDHQGHYRSMDRDSDEWRIAWAHLASDEINRGLADPEEAWNPDCCEGWQYMGSVRILSGSGWVHQFRHRFHPVTKRREYRDVEGFGLSWSSQG